MGEYDVLATVMIPMLATALVLWITGLSNAKANRSPLFAESVAYIKAWILLAPRSLDINYFRFEVVVVMTLAT